MDPAVFIYNVKARCAELGIKPTIACKESGAGKNLISNLKNGTMPSITRIELLARHLGCSVGALTGEEKNAPAIREDDEDTLDRELISRLVELTPEELEKVDAFVQGLLAAR